MFSPRVKTGAFVLEGVNAFATTLYFNYLFFHMREQFGFTNLGNLFLAAANGLIYAVSVWFAGRFAQRKGYFRALRIGFLTMAFALAGAGCVDRLGTGYAGMVFWTLGMSLTWPSLEAIVSERESSQRLQRLLGVYNVVWAGGSALAAFVGGGLRDTFGARSIFFVPATLHLFQWIVAWRLDRASAATVAAARAQPPPPDDADHRERCRSPVPPAVFMKMAWVANPFSYVAINALIPVIPQRAADLHLGPVAAGVFSSIWYFARAAAFVLLWQWTGWHYRFKWLVGAYLAMAACFAVVLVGGSLWLLVGAQLVFGLGVGLAYYSSLYYSMDVGETKGEHGGFHEAALGTGIFAGPAIGAVSLRFFPDWPNMNTWAASALLMIGLAALYWLRYRRPSKSRKP
ncbi:MAG: MFS transporter [Verrucomicrobia bacterium]|nr:MFS transporter [Verrucomicrobiota bacterium]